MVNSLASVRAKNEPRLLSIPGVIGLGIDEPRQTIQVHVANITQDALNRIPRELEGYKVEVLQSGSFQTA